MRGYHGYRARTIGGAAVLVAACCGSAAAQGTALDPPSCADPALGGAACVRFIGCIEATGEVFDGRALGASPGPLEAMSTAGRICEGTWRILPGGLGGVASGFCEGGGEGGGEGSGQSAERTPFIAYYTYLEPQTGTAEADGFVGQRALTALSGRAIPEFLRNRGAIDGAYQCGDETYPLS